MEKTDLLIEGIEEKIATQEALEKLPEGYYSGLQQLAEQFRQQVNEHSLRYGIKTKTQVNLQAELADNE